MGEDIIFSVIVPIYNVEPYIRKCIDSILSTPYKNMEIILVDDGSPDECPNICEEYQKKDTRIKVIHKQNGGLVSARKVGAKEAKGKYIVSVDGDDYLDPNFFPRLLDVINQYSPDIICFGSVHFNSKQERRHKIGLESGYYNKEDIRQYIFPILFENSKGKYFSPTIWSKIIKRELYVKYQLLVDNRIKIGEDFACTRPCLYFADNMFILDEELYWYRLNENSMTKRKHPFRKEVPFLIGKFLESTINISENNFQAQLHRNICHNLFNVAYTQFYQKESYKYIVNEINALLDCEYYKNALKNCKYDSIKGNIALFILRKKLYFVLKIISLKR